MANLFEIDKSYVSEYDLFLYEFDKNNPKKSESQQKEIKKHQRIAELRDNKTDSDKEVSQ